MTEAMATGTPVVAGRFGSVPEVVVDGETGFICDSLKEMVLALGRLGEIDRTACRRHVEKRFSAQRMAQGYEEVYQRLLRPDASASAGQPPQTLHEPPTTDEQVGPTSVPATKTNGHARPARS